jgi:hypothetical protein
VDIRKDSEALLMEIIKVLDLGQVMKAAKGIQGSALQALQSVFDHQRSLADDSGSTMLGPKSGSRVVSNSGERSSGRTSTQARGATAVSYLLTWRMRRVFGLLYVLCIACFVVFGVDSHVKCL